MKEWLIIQEVGFVWRLVVVHCVADLAADGLVVVGIVVGWLCLRDVDVLLG